MNLAAILGYLSPYLAFITEHSDLLELLYEAITKGSLTKTQVMQLVRDAIVAASDAEIKREFPQG
jgi:hypothetical protein